MIGWTTDKIEVLKLMEFSTGSNGSPTISNLAVLSSSVSISSSYVYGGIKAWAVAWDNAAVNPGVLSSSYNVTGISKSAAGQYIVTLPSNLVTLPYAVIANAFTGSTASSVAVTSSNIVATNLTATNFTMSSTYFTTATIGTNFYSCSFQILSL